MMDFINDAPWWFFVGGACCVFGVPTLLIIGIVLLVSRSSKK
jgi:uncharacterized membrane protein YdcZ (DUF606 family)